MTKDEGIKTAVLVRRCSVRRLANDALITPYESVTSRLCNSHGGGKKTTMLSKIRFTCKRYLLDMLH